MNNSVSITFAPILLRAYVISLPLQTPIFLLVAGQKSTCTLTVQPPEQTEEIRKGLHSNSVDNSANLDFSLLSSFQQSNL